MSTPSLFYGSNVAFLEDLFERYQADPYSVSQDWRAFFASMNPLSSPTGATEGVTSNAIVEHMLTQGLSEVASSAADAQSKVSRLIQAYRMLGHKSAWLSPLAQQPELQDELTLAGKGLAESQLDDVFMTDGVLPEPTASLRDILTALQRTYASTVGVQYANLPNETERNWLRERMEHVQNHPTFTPEHKKNIFTGLMKADRFEKFLHTKFVGMKRFSVEGGDSLIPMLETLTDMAGEYGVSDIVLGMAHRGRLNVLCNIMGKPFEDLFAAFADNAVYAEGDSSAGDVKYHMGKSIDITTKGGQVVHMSLLSNPSHLEAVNPVVEGSVRAKQTLKGDTTRERVIPLLIHGDAAFCGQGIVPETLNLMGLEGYATGGTIHIVINNQIGYTAEPKETFSGDYCTDVARILQIPIFHVNGDDPEACVHVMRLAMAYREEFKRDVVIDLVCYRRHGHNEGDDPTFTQPVMYQNIRTHAVPVALYRQQLAREGVLSEVDAGALEQSYVDVLTQAHTAATSEKKVLTHEVFGGVWQNLKSQHEVEPETKVSATQLADAARGMNTWPATFAINSKVQKIYEKRLNALSGGEDMDWGTAEMAAYATLLQQGYSVRISGQDAQRGTFSHRHAALTDTATARRIIPLASCATKNAQVEVINSPLSELAVMGFEFGYSLSSPNTLTIWEAQFGDFVNGAQIVIDQFLSSSETKWQRYSGLVLLLPHGMEGQGPEHSSARLERFLQLCGENNMTVVNPTTPAQMFHLLRRHMLRTTRRPLVVMTPKSLLRLPEAVSPATHLTTGGFCEVLADSGVKPADVKRVLLCSGKVYYDLVNQRTETKNTQTAIVRVEQFYPLPLEALKGALSAYSNVQECVWVQEEPRNQGGWTFVLDNLAPHLPTALQFVGRPMAASPAVGTTKRHAVEQKQIIEQAFAPLEKSAAISAGKVKKFAIWN